MITCTSFLPGRITPDTPADLIFFSSTKVLSLTVNLNLVIQLPAVTTFSLPPTPSRIILATSVKSLLANLADFSAS